MAGSQNIYVIYLTEIFLASLYDCRIYDYLINYPYVRILGKILKREIRKLQI